ncbi:glyoxylase-like metal-dependent hydrolase (beta-lactamase superfamily II) [Ruminiclostridium sufflavum DSM 19573]|uniref:Glyoxylase-like metal-dependent hydrolase (Beta-lactamase superfamily II) n=1 Tax=Ruminiclostridium sufflavum DSM 19573 TaxID=1121337 RepID=A0A318XQC2_9FIRM|nr:MBL fold metallo-hydrolase [Ruminiclostridium sufflavum]PYG90275.1 glyoxylase-like metal-dependent hydrolase (beta-lactamase superfamily II) [Ruminiclostridium sufflavum DSM 19573]
MKILNGVYQISGWMNGVNSNTFALETEKGLILIDCGYSEKQYQAMGKSLEFWGLDINSVKDAFITHSHFDHAGNAHIFKKNGARVLIGEDDRNSIECGDACTLEQLFGGSFHTCTADYGLKDGEVFDYGNATIEIVGMPGHTKGSIALMADINNVKILFTGDIFIISGATPADELNLELGWNGDPHFCAKKSIESFYKLRKLKADIIAPGHSSIYYGNSQELFERLYKKAVEELTIK